MYRTQKGGKVPLTRREHVHQVIECHETIVPISEMSRVTNCY